MAPGSCRVSTGEDPHFSSAWDWNTDKFGRASRLPTIRAEVAFTMLRSVLLFFLLLAAAEALLAASPASCQEAVASEIREGADPERDVGPAWPPSEADSLVLAGGERLRGSLGGLRDQVIHFKSDDLGGVDVAFGKVVRIDSHAPKTFVFAGEKIVVGVGEIGETEVFITDETGTQTFRRSDLLSIVEGEVDEWSHWSGGASVGLTANSGNSSQMDTLILANLLRRDAKLRLSLDFRSNLGESDGKETINNQLAEGRVDFFLGEKFYLIPASVEYYSDRFQNIDSRLSPGAGVGYEIFDRAALEWAIDAAILYQRTRYVSSSAGNSLLAEAVAIDLGSRLKVALTSRADLEIDYSTTFNPEDAADLDQHGLVKLNVALNQYFSLNLAFIWDRVGAPEPDALGIIPKRDDLKISFGLGFGF